MTVRVLCLQTLSEKLSEQEMQFRRLSQEQLDGFTLDINTAYARLKGIEQAVEGESYKPAIYTQTHGLKERKIIESANPSGYLNT